MQLTDDGDNNNDDDNEKITSLKIVTFFSVGIVYDLLQGCARTVPLVTSTLLLLLKILVFA